MAWGRRREGWIGVALLLLVPALSPAAPPPIPLLDAPAPPATPASTDRKAEAEEHFNKGKALYTQGDTSAALAEFLLALKLAPLWNATYNAGICLDKLQRYDEALDMFEAVLRDFGPTIPAGNKEVAQRKVARLRELVGTIEVEDAEPGASIVIDGRDRGEYPSVAPLRVAAGGHLVRVSKSGFAVFEARVDVAGKQVVRVPARLVALTRSGRLIITEQSGKVLDVLVDGSPVGKTPWAGQIAVGGHVVVLQGVQGEGDAIGAPPVPVTIKLDETTALRLTAEELRARLRVQPVPVTATVAIDAVTVGSGGWEGRLRAGRHRIEVAAEGFFASAQDVLLTSDELRVFDVTLERDRASLFRRAPRKPRLLAEIASGVAIVPSFGGGVSAACKAAPCSASVGVGAHSVVRGGYELGSGFGVGLVAGYLTARQSLSELPTKMHRFAAPARPYLDVTVTARDTLALRGLTVGAWAGYTLGEKLPMHFRLDLGALIGSASDARLVDPIKLAGSGPTAVSAVLERYTAAFLYAAPEVRAGLPLGKHAELSLGIAAPILLRIGTPPTWSGPAHGVNAGTTGYGYFNEDTFTGAIVVAIEPGVGARFDF